MLGRSDTVLCTSPFAALPFLDLLEPARAAGFTALSIAPPHVSRLQADGVGAGEVRRRLADAGLQLGEMDAIAGWLPAEGRTCFLGREMGEMVMAMTPDRVIAAAAELGARSVTVVDTFNPAPHPDQAAESFAQICDLAAGHGLFAHIEFIPAGGIPTLTTAAEIVRRANRRNGGITLDTLHFFRSGGTLQDLRRIPAEQILTVQLADAEARPADDPVEELMLGRLIPGDGELDLAGVVRVLDEIGADAPLGVEIFSPETASQDTSTTARRWMQGLRTVVRQADR